MPTTQATGQQILEDLRSRVSRKHFDLWFSTLEVAAQAPGEVTFSVSGEFRRDWLMSFHRPALEQSVTEVCGEGTSLCVVAKEEAPLPDEGSTPLPSPASEGATERNEQFFLTHSDIALNDRYTFENFVVGPSNQLAHAASLAVAQAPAGSYNPLFLHGGVGLGKTHLLQGVCLRALQVGHQRNILYLSSETFLNEFIAAISRGDLDSFRYRYRMADILVIDDIHLLANKERTQEEFFNTFNALYNAGRQIVLSSDSPPGDIPSFQERLTSRFKWGLVAEIEPPGFETRLAILRKKALARDLHVPEEVLSFLAENIQTNIRELEGAVTKVAGYALLIGRPLDLSVARQALGESSQKGGSQAVIGVNRILDVVCAHYNVRAPDLQGRRRTQSIALPRQVAMFLARQVTPLSLEEIGGHFGGRDHTTVLYAVERTTQKSKESPQFQALLRELEERARR